MYKERRKKHSVCQDNCINAPILVLDSQKEVLQTPITQSAQGAILYPYNRKVSLQRKCYKSNPISLLVSDTILYKETSVLCREGEIYLGREDYK